MDKQDEDSSNGFDNSLSVKPTSLLNMENEIPDNSVNIKLDSNAQDHSSTKSPKVEEVSSKSSEDDISTLNELKSGPSQGLNTDVFEKDASNLPISVSSTDDPYIREPDVGVSVTPKLGVSGPFVEISVISEQMTEFPVIFEPEIQDAIISKPPLETLVDYEPKIKTSDFIGSDVEASVSLKSNEKSNAAFESKVERSIIAEQDVKFSCISEAVVKSPCISEPDVKSSDISELNVKSSDISKTNIKSSDISETNIKSFHISETNVKISSALVSDAEVLTVSEPGLHTSVVSEKAVEASDKLEQEEETSVVPDLNVKHFIESKSNTGITTIPDSILGVSVVSQSDVKSSFEFEISRPVFSKSSADIFSTSKSESVSSELRAGMNVADFETYVVNLDSVKPDMNNMIPVSRFETAVCSEMSSFPSSVSENASESTKTEYDLSEMSLKLKSLIMSPKLTENSSTTLTGFNIGAKVTPKSNKTPLLSDHDNLFVPKGSFEDSIVLNPADVRKMLNVPNKSSKLDVTNTLKKNIPSSDCDKLEKSSSAIESYSSKSDDFETSSGSEESDDSLEHDVMKKLSNANKSEARGYKRSDVESICKKVPEDITRIPYVYTMVCHLNVNTNPFDIIHGVEVISGRDTVFNIQVYLPDRIYFTVLQRDACKILCDNGFMLNDQKVDVEPCMWNVRNVRITAPNSISEGAIKRKLNRKYGCVIAMSFAKSAFQKMINIWTILIEITRTIPEKLSVSNQSVPVEIGRCGKP